MQKEHSATHTARYAIVSLRVLSVQKLPSLTICSYLFYQTFTTRLNIVKLEQTRYVPRFLPWNFCQDPMMGPSFPSSSQGNSSAARARLSISAWTVGGSGTIAVLLFVYGRYEVWLWDPFLERYPNIAAIPGHSCCWKKRAAG